MCSSRQYLLQRWQGHAFSPWLFITLYPIAMIVNSRWPSCMGLPHFPTYAVKPQVSCHPRSMAVPVLKILPCGLFIIHTRRQRETNTNTSMPVAILMMLPYVACYYTPMMIDGALLQTKQHLLTRSSKDECSTGSNNHQSSIGQIILMILPPLSSPPFWSKQFIGGRLDVF